MTHFNLKQKQRPELFSAPESKGSGKQMIMLVVLFFMVVGVMLWTVVARNRKPDPAPGISQASSALPRPSLPPSPALTGYLKPPDTRDPVPLNPAILMDVFDEYDETAKARNVEELTTVERDPFIHVLKYLTTHTHQQVLDNITVPHPKLHPEVTYFDMTNHPSKVRGATVYVSGKLRLYGYFAFPPEFQQASGVNGLWYGNLFDRHNQQYAVRFIEGGESIKEGDTIHLTGVFLKRLWQLSRQSEQEGKSIYSVMPFVVAKRADIYVSKPMDLFTPERLTMFAIAMLLVLALGFVISREIAAASKRRAQKASRTRDAVAVAKQPAADAETPTTETAEPPTSNEEDKHESS